MHDVAARGFAAAGDVYERGRPAYPCQAVAALVERLRIGPGTRAVDVGAGTGKLTRRLVETGAQLAAVEPVADMRASFARLLPGVAVVGGVAEALPLRTGTADAIVVGTAFHWFQGPAALREMHRVLRPGGHLGLVWLARDESVDWLADLVRLVAEYMHGDPPRYDDGRWRRAFEAPDGAALFGPLEAAQFPFAHVADRDTAITRVASTSFIATLSAQEREEVLERVRVLLGTHPATRDCPRLEVPYRADVYWCERR